MPGWHEATQELQEQGELQMVGIIQEQHPDRCRLFMQWKQMGWPILVDSLNLLEVSAVPITLAIDEHGIIREKNLRLDAAPGLRATFLDQTFPAPPENTIAAQVQPPDLDQLQRQARGGEVEPLRRYASALVMWGGPARLNEAIVSYEKALEREPDHGPTQFRLGVALRIRYDTDQRQPKDFTSAVAHWKQALDIDPNQYIWRRRIQQYGPRLDKPYPFYDWVATARDQIRSRGEEPLSLRVEPGGAEFAHPQKSFGASRVIADEPDSGGRIHRDDGHFVAVETTVVPPILEPGEAARVHVVLRPNTETKAHWNNEVDDLEYWIHPPDGWQVDSQRLTVPNPGEAVSQESRKIEFELHAPDQAESGSMGLSSYALYYVCEDVTGTCLYRRRDIEIPIKVRAPLR